MSARTNRYSIMSLVLAFAISPALSPAKADLTQLGLALAPPLAEQFGVPASSVTHLLENGVSVESVTQLLLISQSAETSFADVTQRYRDSANDITKTAESYEVAASEYSMDKVNASIDAAKQKAQSAATQQTTEATQKAADDASKAVGSALGSFGK